MKNRFFSYFAVVGACLSCLNFNALANPVKRPLVIAVIGENEEDNNKIASLILANDDDLKLKDIEITKFNPMELYGAKNNLDFKVAVITYNPKINYDFNKIPSIFRDKFDCMDIILHVSDKNTFTFDKIKSFYDKLNEAVVGEDVYKTMVYSNSGENARIGAWRYMIDKFGNNTSLRYTFFIYNGVREELIKLKDYNALDSYISGMPDARSIYPINLKDRNFTSQIFLDTFKEVYRDFPANRTLERIQKLKKNSKTGSFNWETAQLKNNTTTNAAEFSTQSSNAQNTKQHNGCNPSDGIRNNIQGFNTMGSVKNKRENEIQNGGGNKDKVRLLPYILIPSLAILTPLGGLGVYKLFKHIKSKNIKENKCLVSNSKKSLQKPSQC